MMKLLTKELLSELLSITEAPCLSLYMPTHRSHPENLQDPIRFQNLIKQLEESLLKKYSAAEAKKWLEPLESLSNNLDIWNFTLDGLAVLSAPDVFEVIYLQIPVEEMAVVADSFHTKPLRNYLQSTDRYQLLGLSLHEIKLYEGNRHSLTEIKLSSAIPSTIEEALGEELTEKHSTVASYGGAGSGSGSMHHGHGAKSEEVDIDAERFFRVVSEEIQAHYSKPTGLPLLLAALPEHHALFRKVNKNQLLLPNGLPVNPKSVPLDKLTTLAWEVMEPAYLLKLDAFAETFGQAQANGKGSDDLKEVAQAAAAGRVDTLLLEADRIIPGRINEHTGNTQKKDLTNPAVDDLLDDIGELVTKMGGQVMVIPPDKMPTQTGLAAVFRY